MELIQGHQVLKIRPDGKEEDFFVKNFTKKLVTMKRVMRGRKMIFEVKDKYYSYYIKNNEYVIMNTEAQQFIYEYVRRFSAKNLKVNIKKVFRDEKVKLDFKSKFQPRDEQQYFIDGMLKTYDKNRVLVMARTGYGKMQPDDTPTLTPYGWIDIGSITRGDKVISENGDIITVTNVYKHKNKVQYMFVFEDGRRVESGLDHLWDVIIDNGTLTLSTRDIIKLLDDNIDIGIPNFSPIINGQVNLLYYMCGIAYINGYVDDNTLMLFGQTNNRYLMDNISKWNISIDDNRIYILDNKRVDVINLYKKLVQNGKLTDDLLFSTVENRASFIQAIKTISHKVSDSISELSFCPNNSSRCVKTLLHSLGYKVYQIDDKTLHYELNEQPLKLHSYYQSRVCDATCIEVNSPTELYVTKDYIVTHNTYMANLVFSKMSYRVLLYLKPTYINKWVMDLNEYFNLEEDDIFIIRGSKSFCELYKMEVKPRFIIISTSTFHNYMDYYTNTIKTKKENYCIAPDKLMSELKIHTFLSDETHKNFNNVYRAILALDPKKVIGLTATLITKDSKLNRFYLSLFPLENRLDLLTYRRFIKLENISYYIDTGKQFKVSTSYGYDHKRFETYIMRNKLLLDSYLDMILCMVESRYIKRKRKSDRMLIFAKSLEMITVITDKLKTIYPDLDIREYTGKDKFDNALSPDIRISHPQVFAEAIDVKNLIYTLNTVNIDSISTYIQMIGRLRYIEDFDVQFTQLYCQNIPQHKKYIDGNRSFVEMVVEKYNNDVYHKQLKY